MLRKSGILRATQCLLTCHCISQKTNIIWCQKCTWPGISRKISACMRLWNYDREVIPKGPLPHPEWAALHPWSNALRAAGGGWVPSRAVSSASVTERGGPSVVAAETGLSWEGKGAYHFWNLKKWYFNQYLRSLVIPIGSSSFHNRQLDCRS